MLVEICPHCRKYLMESSEVSELYFTICDITLSTQKPVTISENDDLIRDSEDDCNYLRFLELKGFITTLEIENNRVKVRPNIRLHNNRKAYLCSDDLHSYCDAVD